MKHRVKRSLSLLCALAVLVGMMPMSALAVDDGVEPYAAGDTSSVADSATLTSWTEGMQDSSRDTGRIWTDKSVSKEENVTLTGDVGSVTINKTEGADFLVGLSALSSASSLATTTSKPLDIVLVLDESGSMAYSIDGGTVYEEVYSDQLDRRDSYFIKHGDNYVQVSWHNFGNRWDTDYAWAYWSDGSWTRVTPKTSASDSENTQFYERQQLDTRREALKYATNNFIDTVAAQNEGKEEAQKHRIGIVTYASDSDIENYLTTDTTSLKNTINGLKASGATNAAAGMNSAKTVLNGARSEAQKVVIFFTDGKPTTGTEFSDTVASGAVSAAKDLKAQQTIIYSVGIFDGADPNDDVSGFFTSDENKFMQAVSSNYPNATYSQGWLGGYSWNFGDRADGTYYLAASDAQGLNDVFNAISKDMQQAASPTEVTNNDPQHSGYITFTDTLGEYMEVKGVNAVVYAGEKHDATYDSETKKVTINDPQVDGNEIYGSANLNDIQITVTEGQNGAGDTVEVKIPASLIPLRYYDIKTENGETSMTIRGNAYPIRVFYSVGLKDGVKDQVKSGNYSDPTLQTYVNGHKDAAGAYFYSNAYDAAENRENGSTTAEFTPAETNSFYYFTENTPLYVKGNDNNYVRATGNLSDQTTYYYQINYYELNGGNTTAETYWVAVPGSYLANAQVTGSDDEGIYIREGARRTTRAQAFALPKEEGANETSTALNAISPSWKRGMDDGVNSVTVYLGNNGKLTVEPSSGSLKITKNVAAAAGHKLPGDVENKEFQFSITLKNSTGAALTGPYDYKIGETTGRLTLNDAGTGTFTLEKDQTIEIFGLSVGDQYTVSESSYTEDGYTTTWTGNTSGSMTDAGVSLTCTNTYQAEETILPGNDPTNGKLRISKTIEGRDWQDDDSFTFTISADSGNPDTAAIPSPNTVTINKDDASDNYTDAFGDITFTKPGIYKYSITENDTDIAGISKDETIYTVTVPVTDNNGQLEIGEVTYQKDGVDYTSYSTDSMKFTNEFSAEQKKVQLNGLKVLNGDRTPGLRAGEFSFKLISVSDGTNTYDADNSNIPEGFPMPANANEIGVTVTNDANGYINFGNITFTGDDIGTTYSYTIKEVAQLNQVNGINLMTVEDGITFDETEYTIRVEVSDASTASGAAIQVVPEDENGEAYGLFTVTNTYKTSGTIGDGDGSTAIKVKKVIEGRDWQDGDSFEFTLAAVSGAPMPTSDKVTITNATADHTASFGEITFNKAGIYTYQIAETEGNIGGMTYAKTPVTVTVVVEDDGKGNLTAKSITYDGTVADAATFTNSYKATGTLVGSTNLKVSKKLDGREWKNGDSFTVTISSADANAPMPTGGSTIELDMYGRNSAFGDITFDQDDIDRAKDETTFTYTIKENHAGETINGMTYSEAEYQVVVTIKDNGNGTLDVSSTMTKVKDDDGTEASAEIQENTAAFTNTYKADPTNVTIGAGAELTKIFDAGTRGWKDTDKFTFKIAQNTTEDKYKIDLDTVTTGVQNEATVTVGKPSSGNTANFTFGPYKFEYADTYHFTVTEQNGGQTIDGITYDGHVANVTVTVEDKGTGKLTATVAISDGEFTNTYGINPGETYELDGDTFLRVVKELKGRGWTDNDRFTFKIEAVTNNAPMPAEDTITIDADTPDHAAAFGDITFEAKHLTGNATYQYKITEVEGNLPNMQYDNREITVTVTLEDDGSGELDATVTYSGGELKFTNTYVDPGNVSIKPADITIYMGGEDGYEAVVGEDGSTVETNNSLPEPLFYIEMPEGSTGDPLDLIFNSTEEIIDPETEEQHTKAWRVSELAGQDSEGNNLYYMESVYAFQDDVRVQYVNGDTAITNDQFDPSVVNNLFEDFTIELYTGTVNVGGVTAVLEGSDEVYGITTATGTLRVRAVENGDGTESTNPVFGVQSTAPTTRLPSGQAAVVSNAVYYLLNDTTVKVAKDGVGLLFDDIYDSDNGNNERENALIEKTDEVLGSEGSNVTRHYEAKYLDLVDANNGNAWVKTDGETVTVYWPYPTGTDQNTEFDLLHFAGLHRDTDGGLSGYSPDDIDSVTPTAVEWHTDEAGIYFTVESGGFSPFVLVWETTSSSGGSSSSNKPDDLNTEDHFAYIIGYPKDYRTGEPTDDESLWPVEPQGNITRAEVATIFFRMLTDDARSENWSQTNSFTDVASTEWYNNAISTLANMGIISGDPDGSFRPDDSITRAEFTKIAVGFFDKAGDYVDGTYEDVSASDWYADFIDAAVDLGLIEGYPDGTIRPNASITRAEACTIVNRTLGRVPDKDHLLAEDEMRVWPDNSDTDAWYYAQIQEATNSHDYNWITEDGEEIEEWTDKLADRDWAQLEREWSDANSAPGGEVVD